jgi:hypothetical protein
MRTHRTPHLWIIALETAWLRFGFEIALAAIAVAWVLFLSIIP